MREIDNTVVVYSSFWGILKDTWFQRKINNAVLKEQKKGATFGQDVCVCAQFGYLVFSKIK